MSSNQQTPNSFYVVSNAISSSSPFIEVFETRAPTSYDTNYPIQKRWFNKTTNSEWILTGFTSFNGVLQATWVEFMGSSGVVEDFAVQTGTSPVVPLVSTVTFNGAVVPAGTHPVRTDGTGANTMALEVQISQAIAATDATKIGLAAFDSASFTVDANGYVSLVGGSGAVIEKINLDTGTSPIVPSSGAITLTAGTVAAGTHPIRTDGTGPNTAKIEAQFSQAIAATDATKVGLCNFDSARFTVDANGFVSLGGSGVVETLTADTGGALAPTAGNFNIFGGVGISTSGSGSTITINNKGASPTSGVVNLGVSYSGGTFKVTSASGSALSATNPGYVTLQGKTAGIVKTVAVTSDQSFVDATGASTISGNLFGLTTGIAFTQDIPFWIYAVLNDAETAISFMISRYPGATGSPAAAKIGKTGSAVADSQGSFFALSNPTVADYESNPCLNIGSMRMRMSAADDWTVQALDNGDGIGEFQLSRGFVMTTGQFGAASGKYFYDNGGTAPAFTSTSFNYYFQDLSGFFHYFFEGTNVSTAGIGAVTLLLALPYIIAGAVHGSGYTGAAGAPTGTIIPKLFTASTNKTALAAPASARFFLNNDFTLTTDMSMCGYISAVNS